MKRKGNSKSLKVRERKSEGKSERRKKEILTGVYTVKKLSDKIERRGVTTVWL